MTCKVYCNLTHLIDRPHMQTCPRWIEGGPLAYMVTSPPLDSLTPCFLRKYHGFSNFRMVDFSALLNNMWTCLWSVCRLKPIKPIEISIGDGIQDPRSKIVQRSVGRILDPD